MLRFSLDTAQAIAYLPPESNILSKNILEIYNNLIEKLRISKKVYIFCLTLYYCLNIDWGWLFLVHHRLIPVVYVHLSYIEYK